MSPGGARTPGLPAPFGNYTLLKKLAEGGMAEIYVASEGGLEGFSKLLVIKRILPEYSNHGAFAVMLSDEARIVATLAHPNIVQTFKSGSINGVLYIAMEYLPGENLLTVGQALRQNGGWFELGHSLTIISEAAMGLHYAHVKEYGGESLEIVHRDVTPKNLVISYEGAVKILDFGIAKAAKKGYATQSGTLKGSIPYMSPEQAAGDEVDRRSDIFSLGIVLYELTTQQRFCRGKNDYEMIKFIIEGQIPRPTEVQPGYPPELEAVVLRALERPLDRRYQTCLELYNDLRRVGQTLGLALGPLPLGEIMRARFGHKVEDLRDMERQAQAFSGRQVSSGAGTAPGVREDSREPTVIGKGRRRLQQVESTQELPPPRPGSSGSQPQVSSGMSSAPGVLAGDATADHPGALSIGSGQGSDRLETGPALVVTRTQNRPAPGRRRGARELLVAGLLTVAVVLTVAVLVPRENMQSWLQPLTGRGPEPAAGRAGGTPTGEVGAAGRPEAVRPAAPGAADGGAAPAAPGAARADAGAVAAAAGPVPGDGGAGAPAADGGAATGADAGARQVTLQLQTRPPGATVLLDGEARGVTPLSLSLPATGAVRTVRFRLAGYRESTQTWTAESDSQLKSDLAPLPAAPRKVRPRAIPGMVDPFQ